METESKKYPDVDNITTFLIIDVNKEYSEFEFFYEDNKDTIYKGIVSLYENLAKIKKLESLKIVVKSIIDNYKWDANLVFERINTDVLMTFILPYYENNEEYEMCSHIMKIYNKLQ